MFLIEVTALVDTRRRLSDDAITDVLEAIVDDLDARSLEPSAGSERVREDIEITVVVTVDELEEFDALASATSAVKAAFQAAGIDGTRMVPRDLRFRTMPLQPA